MSAFQDFAIHDDQPVAPCLSCSDRAAGCHAKCRRYRLYRQICRAAAEKRRVESRLTEAEERRHERIDRLSMKSKKKTWRK